MGGEKARKIIKKLLWKLIYLILVAGLMFLLAWLLSVPRVYAVEPHFVFLAAKPIEKPAKEKEPTPNEVKAYIIEQAKSRGVNPIIADWIVGHESQYGRNMSGDDGNSRGYWQISNIYHPEVSDTCANNLKCSTQWSLNQILKGKIQEWSTWKFRKQWYANAPD